MDVRIKKLLFIKDDLIGDLVYSSGSISFLKKKYDVYVILREDFVEIAKLFLHFDKIIPVDIIKYKKSRSYRREFLSRIKSYNFDVALGSIIWSGVNVDILRNSGAASRWIYKRKKTLKEIFRLRFLNKVDSLNPKKNDIFISNLEHEAYFLKKSLNIDVDIKNIVPNLPYFKKNKASEPYIIYLSDASVKKRIYPVDKLLPILSELSLKYNIKVLVTAVKSFEIKEKNLINLTGKTNIREMIELVQSSLGVIGNESGFTHLSWSANVKTIMLLGGGHYGRLYPFKSCLLLTKKLDCYCCNWKCIYKTAVYPCMEIDVDYIKQSLDCFFRTI